MTKGRLGAGEAVSPRPVRKGPRLPALVVAAAGVLPWAAAGATPYRHVWHRQAVLGENGSRYYLLETWHVNPGTHYGFAERQRIVGIEKRSGAVAESVEVVRAHYAVDVNTYVQSVAFDTLPPFDLAAFLRGRSVSPPFSADWPPARMDTAGLVIPWEDGTEVLLPMAAILARVPESLDPPEPSTIRLLGIEFTEAQPDSGLPRMLYYRIQTRDPGSDIDASELVFMIPAPGP
jgi:hypothetical protein